MGEVLEFKPRVYAHQKRIVQTPIIYQHGGLWYTGTITAHEDADVEAILASIKATAEIDLTILPA